MVFQYKRVLLIGATSGIGAALADRLVLEGAKVVAVGRRKDRLEAFVAKHGKDKASYAVFDTTDRAGLDAFVTSITSSYPDLDSVILNSGIQSPINLSKPESVDLDAFHREIDTNFTSVVNLSIKFLPFLLGKGQPTSLVLTGTHLSLVPAVSLPAYSASKAAMRSYFDCLRRQNKGSSVRFMEISPPVVQTELHDYMGHDTGRGMGMPVGEFVDKVYAGLAKDQEHIDIGLPGGATEEEYKQLIGARQAIFDKLSNIMMQAK